MGAATKIARRKQIATRHAFVLIIALNLLVYSLDDNTRLCRDATIWGVSGKVLIDNKIIVFYQLTLFPIAVYYKRLTFIKGYSLSTRNNICNRRITP
jgi:hypothetical protein